MSRVALAGLVGGVACVVACSSGGDGVGETAQAVEVGSATGGTVLPGSSCPANSVVMTLAAGTKPAEVKGNGGVWVPAPLFASSAPGLMGYWSFAWSSATVPADFASLAAYATTLGGSVQRDCPAVTALGTSVTDEVWPTMRAKNTERTSRLTTLPSSPAPTQVQVAVVDSAALAYTSTSSDTFDHGRTVGRAIRELSCPAEFSGGSGPLPFVTNPILGPSTSPCVGQILNSPALVQVTPTTTNTALGGYFGTQSELALAIVRAVNTWLATPTTTRSPHLVVNLSVGWDSGQGYGGEYDDDEPTALPPAARAVQAAITHAVCEGALVVVAAGNQSTPGSSGPMFPAAWETHAGPTARACESFEGSATLPADPATITYRPLVHAVGGLDAVDAPLSNTRPLGRPRMAAYGAEVVTVDPRAVHTDMLSGTSMAAANVSGIAATVWGYLPTATANQVMQLIYDSSVALSVSADFSLVTPTPTIHRAALCDSVKAATSGTFTCSTPAAYVGSQVSLNWATLDPGFAATPVTATLVGASSLPTSPAGLSEPWVTSQPGSPSCTTCNTHGNVARVGTNPAPSPYFANTGLIARATNTGSGTVTEYFQFTPPAPSAANFTNYTVALPTTSVVGTVTNATVTWGVDGGTTYPTYQTTAPLVLAP